MGGKHDSLFPLWILVYSEKNLNRAQIWRNLCQIRRLRISLLLNLSFAVLVLSRFFFAVSITCRGGLDHKQESDTTPGTSHNTVLEYAIEHERANPPVE